MWNFLQWLFGARLPEHASKRSRWLDQEEYRQLREVQERLDRVRYQLAAIDREHLNDAERIQ